jgi:hypothetical protein
MLGGATNFLPGIKGAISSLATSDEDYTPVLILLTDGTGEKEKEAIYEL